MGTNMAQGTTSKLPEGQQTGDVEVAVSTYKARFDQQEALAQQAKWEGYQAELMSNFPESLPIEEAIEIPPEPLGIGANRRAFYVCNDIGGKWILLPPVTPRQINASRVIRWYLTGNLSSRFTNAMAYHNMYIYGMKVKTYPKFPGREAHYLRALLTRITAGSQVSPRGYFRTSKYSREYDDEDEEDETDLEEEEDEMRGEGDDTVYSSLRFQAPPLNALVDSSYELWCHHVSYLLKQGRVVWFNTKSNPVKMPRSPLAEDDDDEDYDETEEEDGEDAEDDREYGPLLFSSLAEDKCSDGKAAWSVRASSTVFSEFQVASIHSNIWPGAAALCTVKGKVENIYLGDGSKYMGRSYSPPFPIESQLEYFIGPELNETTDPNVEAEEAWLAKIQLEEIADIENEFMDNEEEPTSAEEGDTEMDESDDD